MTSTMTYPVQRVVNWYCGNFCARKCFSKESRLSDCYEKFKRIVDSNKDLTITHKEFKDLVDESHIKICKLKPNFRKKTIGWNQFEAWSKDPEFDPDKID